MKKILKAMSLIWGLLFLGGVIWYIFFLHTLPTETYLSLHTSHILFPSYLLMACGLLSFIFTHAFGGYSGEKEVVYVDRIISSKKEEVIETSEVQNEKLDAEILSGLEVVLRSIPSNNDPSENILFFLAEKLKAGQGILYRTETEGIKNILNATATYAYSKDKSEQLQFEFGEGLAGLAAKENKIMFIENVPQGYIKVFSGLGSASPSHLLILPLVHEGIVTGILELGLFEKPKADLNVFFKELSAKLGNALSKKVAFVTEKQNHLAC